MAQKQFTSAVSNVASLSGKFKFDPATGSTTKYNLDNGPTLDPFNVSWNAGTKVLSFQVTTNNVTYTFSGTYTPVASPGKDYFANGTCSHASLTGEEDTWTATATTTTATARKKK